jgi:hypothetical protein
MLKSLYKITLVWVLSLSLFNLSITNAMGGTNSSSSYQNSETLNTGGGDDTNLMATLTMVAVGLLAAKFITCKNTIDMYLVLAGGVALIAGDIYAYIALKDSLKTIETQIKRNEEGKLEQNQIESLKQLEASYEDAKKIAKVKKDLQTAAAIAFGAATAAALVLSIGEETAQTACTTALTAANGCLTSAALAAAANAALVSVKTIRLTPKPSTAGMTAATTAETTFATALTTAETGFGVSLGVYTAACAVPYTAAAACPIEPFCAAAVADVPLACGAVIPLLKANEGMCTALSIADNKSSKSKDSYYAFSALQSKLKLLSMMQQVLIKKSEASSDIFSTMGITATAAVVFLVAVSKSLSATIDSFLLSPMNRAMAWGVMTGVTASSISATQRVIDKAQQDIDAIEQTINSMNNLGGTGTTNGTVTNPTLNSGFNQQSYTIKGNGDIPLNTGNGGTFPCETGDNSKNCQPLSSLVNTNVALANMPPIVQAQFGNAMKVADGLNGKSSISGSTMSAARSMAGSSNAISDEIKKKKKELQSLLDKNGKNINLDKMEADFKDSINKAVLKELKNSGKSAAGMLASFGGGYSKSATDAKPEGTAKSSKKAAVAPVIAIPSMPDYSDKSGLDKDNKKGEVAAAVDPNAKSTATMDDYELKNDITKDKDTSIFDLISNRYQRSGYQRLFKVK